jgi:beta-phosphoglucomutase-like phosphatase (HAD superfamily)
VKLKALIFDVDGTLADTEEAHRRSFNEAFRTQGLPWSWDRSKYAELLLTTGGKERIAAFLDSLDLPQTQRLEMADRIPEIHREKTRIYTNLVNGGEVPLREGVTQLLDAAVGAGVRLSIASTTTFANIEALLTTNLGAGALQRFAAIGSADDAERKKPAPDVYEFVLKKLGLPAGACVAVEDSANGLKAAKAAGLFTVVTPGYWTQAEDFGAADMLLSDLGRLQPPLAELERRLMMEERAA